LYSEPCSAVFWPALPMRPMAVSSLVCSTRHHYVSLPSVNRLFAFEFPTKG
jgi:hypothetical protein